MLFSVTGRRPRREYGNVQSRLEYLAKHSISAPLKRRGSLSMIVVSISIINSLFERKETCRDERDRPSKRSTYIEVRRS